MTLLLVHGCGTDRHFWDPLREALGDLPSVAYSLPGRDDVPGPAPSTAAAAARWLAARASADGVAQPVVVGHSYGGAIAIELALLAAADELEGFAPRALVLVSTGARLRVAPAVLALVGEAASSGIPCDLGAYVFRPSTDPAIVALGRTRSRATPPATTQQDWLATDAFDRLREVPAITLPTLAIAGKDDVLTPPRYAEYLTRSIVGSTCELVDDAGHMLPMERAVDLAARLRRFTTAIATRSAPAADGS